MKTCTRHSVPLMMMIAFAIIVAGPAFAQMDQAPQTTAAPSMVAPSDTMAAEVPAATPLSELAPATMPPPAMPPVMPPPSQDMRRQGMDFATLKAAIFDRLLKLASAIAVLVIGFIIAKFLSGSISLFVSRTGLNKRIATAVGGEKEMPYEGSVIAGGVIFWITMMLTLVAFFDALGLQATTGPLNLFLGKVLYYLPDVLGAGLLFLVALVIANFASRGVIVGLQATHADEMILKKTGVSETEAKGHTESLGKLVYGLVFLLFLPAILSALGIQGLMEPVQNMVEKAISIIPNILGAFVILVSGWFLAKILRQVTANVLSASGLDACAAKAGLSGAGAQPLSQICGTLVYTLILIPVFTAALQVLSITAISEPATRMLELVLHAIPKVFGAALILFISYFMARLVSDLVANLLRGTGFDNILKNVGFTAAGGKTPSDVVGYLVLTGILVFASIEAAEMLGFAIVAGLLAQFISFAGQVALAAVVLVIGLYFAKIAHTVILGTGGPSAPLTAQIARAAIVVFASAMALRQTGIADDIVNLTFAFFVGTISVSAALAFGLGCRELAAQAMKDAVAKFKTK
jgi:hypothetical protein